MLKTALANIDSKFESLSLRPTNEQQRSILADAIAGKPDGLDDAYGILEDWEARLGVDVDNVRSLLPRREG